MIEPKLPSIIDRDIDCLIVFVIQTGQRVEGEEGVQQPHVPGSKPLHSRSDPVLAGGRLRA